MTRLTDGFPTTVTFYDDDSLGSPIAVQFWEKTVKPGGYSGGGPNNTTTMRNISRRTKQPKKLVDTKPLQLKCAYDPQIVDSIESLINVLKWVVVDYPDGSSVGNWGWLDDVDFDDITEGSQPECTIMVEISNQDADSVEVGPVYIAPS